MTAATDEPPVEPGDEHDDLKFAATSDFPPSKDDD